MIQYFGSKTEPSKAETAIFSPFLQYTGRYMIAQIHYY